MRVAYLAAGTSSRLLPLTKRDHKALLPICEELLIVDLQLTTLTAAGATAFTAVVGHGGAALARHLEAGSAPLECEIVWNPDYVEKNLDLSALLALQSAPGPVLYYEGDMLCSPELLRRLLSAEATIALACSREPGSDTVDTQVLVRDGRVAGLQFAEHGVASAPAGAESAGEFICVVKLDEAARRHVVDRLSRLSFTGPMQLYEILDEAFGMFPTALVDAGSEPWIEIDNAADYARAQALAPLIQSRCGSPPP